MKKPHKRLKLGSVKYPGRHTLVDASDYEDLMQYSWYVHKEKNCASGERYVAEARVNGKYIHMSRYLMKAKPGQIVDHINRNPLDNRRANLRFVTRSQNRHNMLRRHNKAGHKGIYKVLNLDLYTAEVSIKGKKYNLGYFKKKREAIKVYREFVTKRLKEFAVF